MSSQQQPRVGRRIVRVPLSATRRVLSAGPANCGLVAIALALGGEEIQPADLFDEERAGLLVQCDCLGEHGWYGHDCYEQDDDLEWAYAQSTVNDTHATAFGREAEREFDPTSEEQEFAGVDSVVWRRLDGAWDVARSA